MRSLTLFIFCILVASFQFSCTPESLESELDMNMPTEFYGDSGEEETPENERD